jgi:hypothetical protein
MVCKSGNEIIAFFNAASPGAVPEIAQKYKVFILKTFSYFACVNIIAKGTIHTILQNIPRQKLRC